MTTHETIAAEIAAATREDIAHPAGVGPATYHRVTESMRQGDLLLRRIGDPGPTPSATPTGGIVLAAGAHGEHRLICDAAHVVDETTFDVGCDALVVHTDRPEARHGTGVLCPGRWQYGIEREMRAGEIARVDD